MAGFEISATQAARPDAAATEKVRHVRKGAVGLLTSTEPVDGIDAAMMIHPSGVDLAIYPLLLIAWERGWRMSPLPPLSRRVPLLPSQRPRNARGQGHGPRV